jgi:hypothetical protein
VSAPPRGAIAARTRHVPKPRDALIRCAAPVSAPQQTRMIELNPVRFQIADLNARLAALRGYL